MTRFLLLAALAIAAFSACAPAAAQPAVPKYYFTFKADLEEVEGQSDGQSGEPSKGEFDLVNAMAESLEIAGARLDAIGELAYQLQYLGDDKIELILIEENAPQIARDVFGIRGDIAFMLVEEEVSDVLPRDAGKEVHGKQVLRMADEMRSFVVVETGAVRGDQMIRAVSSIDEATGQSTLLVTFDEQGREAIAALTRNNVGAMLAIVIDGAVISAPVIREPILDGKVQISGGFSQGETRQLAITLWSGALPLPFTLIEERRADGERVPR